MYLTFAWRYFKGKKTTTAINVIAWVTISVIAFATCCQLLVLSVFNGLEGLVKSLYSSFYTDLKVTPSKGKTFTLDSSQLARIRQQPYTGDISLVAEEKALLQSADLQTVIYLKGVDDHYPAVSGVAAKTTVGKYNTGTTDDPGLIVGAGIEGQIGIDVDPAHPSSPLTIILPKKSQSNDPLQSLSEGNAKATGVFSIQQEFDNKYAITNIGFVKQQMGFAPDEYSSIEIRLKEKAPIGKAKDDLSRLLGNGYTVQSRYEQNTSLYSTMQMEKWAIYAILTLILIIAAFNMIGALTMLVLEKQKDIAVLQSMGAGTNIIQKIFLSEGLLLGGIGAATGIILAIIICGLQVRFKLVKLEGASFLIDYFPVKILATDCALVAATAISIAFIASWLPARKAARQAFILR